jgi:hypothetical protein
MNRRRLRNHTILLPWERKNAFQGRVALSKHVASFVAVLLGAALLLVAYRAADEQARTRATRASIAEARRAVTAFVAELGRCPHSSVELMHPPKAGAHYLNELPLDGWGHALYIRCPGAALDDVAEVISAGPHGSFLVDDHIL